MIDSTIQALTIAPLVLQTVPNVATELEFVQNVYRLIHSAAINALVTPIQPSSGSTLPPNFARTLSLAQPASIMMEVTNALHVQPTALPVHLRREYAVLVMQLLLLIL